MKVQLITGNNIRGNEIIEVSRISEPRALDDFDVNIIDLSFEGLWRNQSAYVGYLDLENDLSSIGTMVKGSNKTCIIYVYPQNVSYYYHYSSSGRYYNCEKLKNILVNDHYSQHYRKCFPYENIGMKIVFERTNTTICGQEFMADFHFEKGIGNIVTESNVSKKITTIRLEDKYYYTTLDICSSIEKTNLFIEYLFADNDESEIPQWVKDYKFGNDVEQMQIIHNSREKINDLERIIEESEGILRENNRYKTVLCNNGEALVKVVFDILENILECDLSQFVDENREDFLIEKDGDVFIGEIKGVTSNVKNGFISQLDVHYQNYIDELRDDQNEKNVYGLLIINPFRTKELDEREPIHEKQIDLAKRNRSLIIETVTLLRIFELYRDKRVSSEKIINALKNKTGLLKIEDLEI